MSAASTNVHLPFPWNSPMALQAARIEIAETLGRSPCPLCGYPLVVRLDRRGPYFHCMCPRRTPTSAAA